MERAAPHKSPDSGHLAIAELCARRWPRIVAADDSPLHRLMYQSHLLPITADSSSSCVLGATWEEAQRIVQVVLGRMAPDGTDADMAPADVVILDQAWRRIPWLLAALAAPRASGRRTRPTSPRAPARARAAASAARPEGPKATPRARARTQTIPTRTPRGHPRAKTPRLARTRTKTPPHTQVAVGPTRLCSPPPTPSQNMEYGDKLVLGTQIARELHAVSPRFRGRVIIRSADSAESLRQYQRVSGVDLVLSKSSDTVRV